tara:strand:- start:1860 stop:2789 length:930 start_codon:yes stop_codon:yes gene_type:complete
MFTKILFSSIFLILLISKSFSNINLTINTIINDIIITNHDIKKESDYLKKLNPDLSKIDDQKIFEIAKESLIKETIKKKEIMKLFDLKKDDKIIEQIIKDFYTKLNFSNKEEFISSLKKEDGYQMNEIRQKLKIEMLWNKLIYMKYKNQVKIDENDLIKKIEGFKNENKTEYLIYEIIFKKKQEQKIENLISEIKSSISEVGFKNAANIYSIAETSKFGGEVGWMDINNFSGAIQNELKKTSEGNISRTIQIGNNYIILKVEKIRTKKITINKDDELMKLINFETNRQLSQFSKIYFDKSKINYSINEK